MAKPTHARMLLWSPNPLADERLVVAGLLFAPDERGVARLCALVRRAPLPCAGCLGGRAALRCVGLMLDELEGSVGAGEDEVAFGRLGPQAIQGSWIALGDAIDDPAAWLATFMAPRQPGAR